MMKHFVVNDMTDNMYACYSGSSHLTL